MNRPGFLSRIERRCRCDAASILMIALVFVVIGIAALSHWWLS